jgi:hypothetical protein
MTATKGDIPGAVVLWSCGLQFCGVIYVRLKIDRTADGCRGASPVMCAYQLGNYGLAPPSTPDRCSNALRCMDWKSEPGIFVELAIITMSVVDSNESAA